MSRNHIIDYHVDRQDLSLRDHNTKKNRMKIKIKLHIYKLCY